MTREELTALVTKAKKGDSKAFSALYQEMYDYALNVAKNTFSAHNQNASEAEDVVQDAFVKAFVDLQALKEDIKFKSWFKSIVKNKTIDYIKAKKVDQFKIIEDDNGNKIDSSEFIEETDHTFLPEQLIDDEQTKKIILDCIDKLPQEQKVCVIMFYYDEFSVKDIASHLGVSENTVKSRLNYARKKLEKEFEALEEKKGIKLYGVPFFPLIKLAISSKDSAPQVPTVPTAASTNAVLKKTASKLLLKGKTVKAFNAFFTMSTATKAAAITVTVLLAAGVVGGSVGVAGAIADYISNDSVLVDADLSQQVAPNLNQAYTYASDVIAISQDNRVVAYSKADGVYINNSDYTSEQKIFDTYASSVAFNQNNLYFIANNTLYAYQNNACTPVFTQKLNSLYSFSDCLYALSSNDFYLIDFQSNQLITQKEFENSNWYIDNGWIISTVNSQRVAISVADLSVQQNIGKLKSNDLSQKVFVDGDFAYIPDSNIDETGILYVYNLQKQAQTPTTVSLGNGVVDVAVCNNTVYYSIYDDGFYCLNTDSAQSTKLSNNELYFVSKYESSTAWCNPENLSTIIVTNTNLTSVNYVVSDFAFVGDKLVCKQNNQTVITQ